MEVTLRAGQPVVRVQEDGRLGVARTQHRRPAGREYGKNGMDCGLLNIHMPLAASSLQRLGSSPSSGCYPALDGILFAAKQAGELAVGINSSISATGEGWILTSGGMGCVWRFGPRFPFREDLR
jgi:hypothetical protein